MPNSSRDEEMEIDHLDGLNCDHIYGGDFGIADYTSPNDDRY